MEAFKLSAIDAARAIKKGELTSVELVSACLGRIKSEEPAVGAWAHLDPAHALAQAEQADELRSKSSSLGPLHGVPVGIKDIFDTRDFPTEQGSPIFKGRRPTEDATVVARLRMAGAVILGKTVTTEFAGWHPGKTRNPHDHSRTPGGSSSGSAAAVAAQMVPLALGSQTAGSTIRPGSYCGVIAYKPQFGAISRAGGMYLAQSLDHVGLFSRSVEDAALLHDVLFGPDSEDDVTLDRPATEVLPRLTGNEASDFRLGFLRTPFWEQAEASARAVLQTYCQDRHLKPVTLPDAFSHALLWLSCISAVETAVNFDDLYPDYAEQLSAPFLKDIETGLSTSAVDYVCAREGQKHLRRELDDVFQSCDALLTLAAPGEAPSGLGATGDPVFCSTWTLVGFPAITLPMFRGQNGLPLGLQIIGPQGGDAQLLQVAKSLWDEHKDAHARA